jgi:hypothetical protein
LIIVYINKYTRINATMVESTTQIDTTVMPYDFSVDKVYEYLEKTFAERIVILDGGMGTELQTYRLEEHEYRGK